MKLTYNQRYILDYTAHRAANNLYCGDSDDMQRLVQLGLMVSVRKKPFVPNEYFRITEKGHQALRITQNEI